MRKEFILDVVVSATYSCVIEAENLTEAETKARQAFELGQLGQPIDEQIADIDLVYLEEVE